MEESLQKFDFGNDKSKSQYFVHLLTLAHNGKAFMFYSMAGYPPIWIPSVQPVVDYLENAARLQGSVAAFGSTMLIQQRKFTINTNSLKSSMGPEALHQQLQTSASVRSSVPADCEEFEGFCRIRLAKARCYLEGVKTTLDAPSSKTLRLYLRTSGRFFDLDVGESDGIKAYLGNARKLLFEYNPNDGSIICEGDYGQKRDYTR